MNTETEILRIDPGTGVIYLKVSEGEDSLVRIRPLGGVMHRTITLDTWLSWDRHVWPGSSS